MQQILAIELENFKAFGEKVRFDLAPVTLLYGQNSSGKSSFLHALLYLKDLIETGNADIHRPSLGGGIIDLGGFRQLIYQHDIQRTIRYVLHWDFQDETHVDELRDLGQASVSLEIGIGSDKQPALLSAKVHSPDRFFLALQRSRGSTPFVVEEATGDSPLLADLPSISRSEPLVQKNRFLSAEPALNSASNSLEQYSSLNKVLDALDQKIRTWLSSLFYIGPLRAYPVREFRPERHDHAKADPTGSFEWSRLASDSDLRARVNQSLEHFEVSTKFQFDIYDWLRTENVDRLERDPSLLMAKIEADVKQSGTFSAQDFLAITESHLSHFFDRLAGAIRDNAVSSFPELTIREVDGVARLSHRDIGTGYSQVLPILVAAHGANQKTILVEQPELHIHPGLQCDMADVFLQSAADHENCFILETHSEHLLLRTLKRIRQTTLRELQENDPAVVPEQVRVLFLRRETDGTTVVSKSPDTDGSGFSDGWPKGFFGERTAEMFG